MCIFALAPQDLAVAYLGQHTKITGRLAPHPTHHGTQMMDPNTNGMKDFHHVGQDSSTPVRSLLTTSSVAVARPAGPTPVPVPTLKTVKSSQTSRSGMQSDFECRPRVPVQTAENPFSHAARRSFSFSEVTVHARFIQCLPVQLFYAPGKLPRPAFSHNRFSCTSASVPKDFVSL